MTVASTSYLHSFKNMQLKFVPVMNNNINILLIDNSRIMRAGLSLILSNFSEVEKVIEISMSDFDISQMKISEYDVIIIDIENNNKTDVDIISEIRAKAISSSIIVFTYSRNLNLKDQCILRGADFFFLKSDEYDKLTYTVKRIAEGNLIWRN